jgi:hypothetical protein
MNWIGGFAFWAIDEGASTIGFNEGTRYWRVAEGPAAHRGPHSVEATLGGVAIKAQGGYTQAAGSNMSAAAAAFVESSHSGPSAQPGYRCNFL